MENITIQILYGLIAVTISFVAIVRYVGVKPFSLPSIINSHKPSAPKSKRARTSSTRTGRIRVRPRSKSRSRSMAQLSRSRNAQRRLQARPSRDNIIQPVAETPDTPMVAAIVQVGVPACPTCGLQAPQALMMEHFESSPSHENGTPQLVPMITESKAPGELNLASSEEESKNSMRNLLQMLVPPRAFGRRHQHRTVNPLSQVIQTLEESPGGKIHPLK